MGNGGNPVRHPRSGQPALVGGVSGTEVNRIPTKRGHLIKLKGVNLTHFGNFCHRPPLSEAQVRNVCGERQPEDPRVEQT